MLTRLYSTKNPKVFLDIISNGVSLGRIIIELRSDIAPKTAENFRELCVGSDKTTPEGIKISYKGSPFHKIIPKYMCQGGDFTNWNGDGGWSIYGSKFSSENFKLKHDVQGLVSMVNFGDNTNASQFLITAAPCPWLDGRQTVFGKVVEGMDVVKKMEALGTSNGTTREMVLIEDCGEIRAEKKDY